MGADKAEGEDTCVCVYVREGMEMEMLMSIHCVTVCVCVCACVDTAARRVDVMRRTMMRLSPRYGGMKKRVKQMKNYVSMMLCCCVHSGACNRESERECQWHRSIVKLN